MVTDEHPLLVDLRTARAEYVARATSWHRGALHERDERAAVPVRAGAEHHARIAAWAALSRAWSAAHAAGLVRP